MTKWEDYIITVAPNDKIRDLIRCCRSFDSIVRCRDCKNFERYCKQGDRDAYWCAKVMLYVEPCGFCAWGERKVVDE